MEQERIAYCALNLLLGNRPKLGLELVETFGSAAGVFRDAGPDLGLAIPEFREQGWERALDNAGKELERCAREGAAFICPADSCYPSLLRECEDPPLGLYVKCPATQPDGPSQPDLATQPDVAALPDLFNESVAIAMVGTRDMSSYGRDWCREFVDSIARTGRKVLIVSGLAYGVDITAHEAALEAGLPTIGVMATGIDSVYPSAHQHIASRMASTPGCALVTDYPVGTAPVARNFLRRNRIIAGLASRLILVESRIKGGGMTTARLAYSYEREVYALPGRVWDSRSEGCNHLISKKIAEPVGMPDETVEALGLGRPSAKRDLPGLVAKVYADLDPQMRQDMDTLVKVLMKERGLGPEELARRSGLSGQQVSALTGLLAADGLVTVDLNGACTLR